jgi:ADP-ribose pyrophosphatase YjhB (NUDIX family)
MNRRSAQFCPHCGTRLEERLRFGRLRPVCPHCDYTMFFDPKVAVVGFVTQDDHVLLVKRINDPGRGRWALPAGFMDADEDPRRAAEREIREETGLVVETERLLELLYRPDADGLADLVIVYKMRVTGGDLLASDDAAEAAWFSKDSLPERALATTELLIQRWLAGEL